MLFPPIGEEGQERLRAAKVLVVGCGALGTHTAEYLARAGVGTIRLVDRDLVEWSNLQRQIGFTEEDARRQAPKAPALAAHLARINSDVRLLAEAVELRSDNALELAAGQDLILDGTDNFPTRFLLNDVSYRLGIPWIYAGVIRAEGQVQAFSGRKGPCLRCFMDHAPPPGSVDTCDTAGVLGTAVAAVSSWQSTLALRILVERSATAVSARHVCLSPWTLEARVVRVLPDPSCAVCAHRRFDDLEGREAEVAVRLCGRNAVLVRPARAASPAPAALEAVARRLASLGEVERKPFYVRLRAEDLTVTVFADLRAIFDGLTEPTRARSLYARFVGE